MRLSAPLFVCLLSAMPSFAQEVLLELPQDAERVAFVEEDYARYAAPISPARFGDVDVAELEGALTTSVFQFAAPSSLESLQASLREQLLGQGYLVLLDCTARACGGFDFRQAVQTLPPPQMVVDLGQFGYIAARHPESARVAVVMLSLAGDMGYAQLVEVAPTSAPTQQLAAPTPSGSPDPSKPVSMPRDFFGERGSVVLEGLVFETGSASLSDAEYPGLLALSAFLADNPEARVTLVGHTDAEGALEPNIALSRQRAEAVRTRLIEGFGVSANQLDADGVGYLAPRATNNTQDGKLLNRRVEAVLILR